MISAGDILAFRFPQSDLIEGKLRPALAIKKIEGNFDDWLVCSVWPKITFFLNRLKSSYFSISPSNQLLPLYPNLWTFCSRFHMR